MSGPTLVPVAALVTHARFVPAVERERFATAIHDDLPHVLVLETCHRVEAYVASALDAARVRSVLPTGGLELTGEDAVHHAVAVAVGCDSVVLGEDQVLHQIRASVDAARAAGRLDPALERLFAHAIQAGRRARSWRQGPPRSLADLALASIELQAGPILSARVLVVGAGRMGRLLARAAVAAGASVGVANRSRAGAESLAASAGAAVEPFDPGARIGNFGAVLVALAGPWPIGRATIDALTRSPTIVVDLSVPAAVPARLAEFLGPRLITADALALADPGPEAQDGSAARVEALIDRSTADVVAWLNGRDRRSAAEALVNQADRAREAELAALWRRLPDLEPDAREAIEQMTRHLATRLFREPLERLGRDADGRDERAVRDIFAL